MSNTSDTPQFAKPFVSDSAGSKSLHFSIAATQSQMNTMQPDALVLDYTKTMMGFLLFNHCPDDIAMVGLGGGSLAKFCYRYLPESRMTTVEINPHVIALRDEFLIPKDDDRFTVVHGDGALFMRDPPNLFDIILLDGYEVSGVPASLCSQQFYGQCMQALKPNGILVVNLHSLLPHLDIYLGRIRRAFNDAMFVVEEPATHNCTVFANKGPSLKAPPKGKLHRPEPFDQRAWEQLEDAFSTIAFTMRRR